MPSFLLPLSGILETVESGLMISQACSLCVRRVARCRSVQASGNFDFLVYACMHVPDTSTDADFNECVDVFMST